MPKGGKRVHAGRKPGTLNKRTQAIAAIVAATGKSPLEVMVEAMRYHYEKAQGASDEIAIDERTGKLIAAPKAYHYQFACEYAASAAPYLHPRLASMEVTGAGGGPIEHVVTHEERAEQAAELLAFAKRRMAATGSRNGHSN